MEICCFWQQNIRLRSFLRQGQRSAGTVLPASDARKTLNYPFKLERPKVGSEEITRLGERLAPFYPFSRAAEHQDFIGTGKLHKYSDQEVTS